MVVDKIQTVSKGEKKLEQVIKKVGGVETSYRVYEEAEAKCNAFMVANGMGGWICTGFSIEKFSSFHNGKAVGGILYGMFQRKEQQGTRSFYKVIFFILRFTK